MQSIISDFINKPFVAWIIDYISSHITVSTVGVMIASLGVTIAAINLSYQRRRNLLEESRTTPNFRVLADGSIWSKGWRHLVIDVQNRSDDEIEIKSVWIRPRRLMFAPQLKGKSAPDIKQASRTIILPLKNKIAAKNGWGTDVFWLTPGIDSTCKELRIKVLLQQSAYPYRKWKLHQSVSVPEVNSELQDL
jgi:hypothetical protein